MRSSSALVLSGTGYRAPSLCNPVARRRPTESKSVKCCCTKNCVYTCCIYIVGGWCMSTARVFRSGNSQAVRLPKQFRLKSEEVEIFRRGDEIVLREKDGTMVRAFDLLAGLPDDLVVVAREKDQPQKRKKL